MDVSATMAGWPSQRVLYSSAFIMLNTGSVAVVGHSDDPDQTALGRHCCPDTVSQHLAELWYLLAKPL